eukprot:scaffold256_cov261-Pinguiococcus_pyrenoidosus.AAC.2
MNSSQTRTSMASSPMPARWSTLEISTGPRMRCSSAKICRTGSFTVGAPDCFAKYAFIAANAAGREMDDKELSGEETRISVRKSRFTRAKSFSANASSLADPKPSIKAHRAAVRSAVSISVNARRPRARLREP